MRNEQRLAYGLLALGVVLLLTRLGGADWLWLALLSVTFLVGYVSRKIYGFLVAGGVLMGVAVGTLIDTQSGMLLSLAVGFFAIDRVEPRANRWALFTAGIFAVLGGLSALSAVGLLSSVGFALLLIAAGGYLLLRDRQQPNLSPTADTPATVGETVWTAPAPPAPVETTPRPAVVPAQADLQAATPPPAATAPPITADTATAPPTPDDAAGVTELSPEAQERLRRLEAWRKRTASAEGTPAYIVFSNDTLAKIAAACPRTLDELAAVKGVGPVKLGRYGDLVLGVVRGDAA